MLSDLRFALRSLAKSPGFTAVATLTLALGIALVTVQFSFVDAALIKGLPFPGGGRVQSIEAQNATGRRVMITLHHYALLQERQRSCDFLAAYRGTGVNVSSGGLLPRRYPGVECTAELFALTGVAPQLGRALQPVDNRPDAPPVLVLGDATWRNDFDADPAIVGRAVRVNGAPATIVGVMPPGFAFPINEAVWTNLILRPADVQGWTTTVDMIGRLRAGTSLAAARSEFAVLAADIARDGPKRENFGSRLTMTPFAERQVGVMDNVLWILLAMVGAVLALACINVANLLYVRAVRQRHELAVRLALGASRGRLIRQVLATSTILASLGAVTGALLAAWAAPVVNHFLSDPQKPYWIALQFDGWVLAAVSGLTLFVAVAAGILPALRCLRADPLTALRDGGHGSTELAYGRMNRLLTTGQIVLSAAVLVVATVLSRGVQRAGRDCYPGDATRVLVGSTTFAAVPGNRAPSELEATRRRLREQLLERVAALPGVDAAALTTREPDSVAMPMPVEIAGRPAVARDDREQAQVEFVSPGYFEVFGIAALRGRLFTAADRPESEPVVMVNESFAARMWPGESALGRRCRFEDAENAPRWHTVVGVVPDLPMAGVGRERNVAGAYLPLHETGASRIAVLLRAAGDPLALAPPLRERLNNVAPDQPFRTLLTLDALIEQRLLLARLISTLALVFGLAAALLAAVGIFGVTAFGVESRRREFGVRMALGAMPYGIAGLVLRRGLGQIGIGLAAGLALGWALNRPLQSIPVLRTIARDSAADYSLVALVIVTSVLLACWVPVRRATRVNPVEALRAE
jgi:predicted permease